MPTPETPSLLRQVADQGKAMKIVYLITTGGTIEKTYSGQNGEVANPSSKMERYLRLLRLPDLEVNLVRLMNKDGLNMTDEDRVLLLGMTRAILKEKAPIVITHSTDTMVESGLYLKRAIPYVQVPIVLTGAMTPLGFEGSDGLQNITESLLAVRLIFHGFYVVIHGHYVAIENMWRQGGRFRFSFTFCRTAAT
jgi:L-asparaginase